MKINTSIETSRLGEIRYCSENKETEEISVNSLRDNGSISTGFDGPSDLDGN